MKKNCVTGGAHQYSGNFSGYGYHPLFDNVICWKWWKLRLPMIENSSTTFDRDWYFQAVRSTKYGGVRTWSLQYSFDYNLGVQSVHCRVDDSACNF